MIKLDKNLTKYDGNISSLKTRLGRLVADF